MFAKAKITSPHWKALVNGSGKYWDLEWPSSWTSKWNEYLENLRAVVHFATSYACIHLIDGRSHSTRNYSRRRIRILPRVEWDFACHVASHKFQSRVIHSARLLIVLWRVFGDGSQELPINRSMTTIYHVVEETVQKRTIRQIQEELPSAIEVTIIRLVDAPDGFNV